MHQCQLGHTCTYTLVRNPSYATVSPLAQYCRPHSHNVPSANTSCVSLLSSAAFTRPDLESSSQARSAALGNCSKYGFATLPGSMGLLIGWRRRTLPLTMVLNLQPNGVSCTSPTAPQLHFPVMSKVSVLMLCISSHARKGVSCVVSHRRACWPGREPCIVSDVGESSFIQHA